MTMIEKIADYVVEFGTSKTTTSNYCVYYNDIARHFHIKESWIRKHHYEIKREIDNHVQIIYDTWDIKDDNGDLIGFDMLFCSMYCPNVIIDDDEEM